jgi:hypothetical protein
VVTGPVVTEIYQHFSDWATHIIRLYKGQPYVELEWTAGPIPIHTTWFPPSGAQDNGKGRDDRSVICKRATSNGTTATSAFVVVGQDGSNDCPNGTAKISYKECKQATRELGFGNMDGTNSSNMDDPGGCFVFGPGNLGRAFYHPTKLLGNLWGKELIVKYTSGINSTGTWYTDSNGRR